MNLIGALNSVAEHSVSGLYDTLWSLFTDGLIEWITPLFPIPILGSTGIVTVALVEPIRYLWKLKNNFPITTFIDNLSRFGIPFFTLINDIVQLFTVVPLTILNTIFGFNFINFLAQTATYQYQTFTAVQALMETVQGFG